MAKESIPNMDESRPAQGSLSQPEIAFTISVSKKK
jgi:hypothetical protein